MQELIAQYLEEIEQFNTVSAEELEQFRIKFLSKKGLIPSLFEDFKNVAPEKRREAGQALNELKNKAQEKVNLLKEQIESGAVEAKSDTDLSLPVDFLQLGSRHPLSIVRNEMVQIFSRISLLAEGRDGDDCTLHCFEFGKPPGRYAGHFFIERN
jgi:phenylalanyl-tRNA synthetase alpha chain